MLVSLQKTKIEPTISRAQQALREEGITAGDLRSLLGSLENLRMAVTLTPLHLCGLQYLQPRPGPKQTFLTEQWLQLSSAARFDLRWWAQSLYYNTSSSLMSRSVTMEVWTDA